MSFARTIARAPRAAGTLLRLGLGRLGVASVNVLNRCNQACPMCAVHAAHDREPPLEELERAFRGLREMGVRIVEIAGGEPFLRRDLPELIALLDRLGLLFTLTTNGTALAAEGLAALRGAGGLLQVALSLDSLDAERYRLLRGRDQLDGALAGLARLQGARLPAPLKLNLAMSRHNEAETPALLAFARERGLFLSVFPVNQGPGAHRSDGGVFASTAAERERMALRFEELARLRRRGEPLWEPSAFYRAAAGFLRGEPLAPCGAGELYLDLRADGGVAPCVELPPVANVEDLASGRVTGALRASRAAVERCRAETPCCYTCTVNLAEIARNPLAYAREQLRVQWRNRRGRAAPSPRPSPPAGERERTGPVEPRVTTADDFPLPRSGGGEGRGEGGGRLA